MNKNQNNNPKIFKALALNLGASSKNVRASLLKTKKGLVGKLKYLPSYSKE